MLSAKTIRQALKRQTESRIYERGVGYFRDGMVGKWSAKENPGKTTVTIEGEVEGNDIYDVSLEFVAKTETFVAIDCTCPYDDNCKHAVALGLTYAESLKDTTKNMAPAVKQPDVSISTKTSSSLDEARLRQALKELGLSTESIPKSMIDKLLLFRRPIDSPAAVTNNHKQTAIASIHVQSFNPKDYFLIISSINGYAPIFYKTATRMQASIGAVLTRKDITEKQREFLTYITGGRFQQFQSPPPDPAKLFPLMAESGFPVYTHLPYYREQPLTLDLHPAPLNAKIICAATPMASDQTRVHHAFYFRIPKDYGTKNMAWREQPFYVHGEYLIVEKGDTVESHRLSPLLASIFSRLSPVLAPYGNFDNNIKYLQTELTGDEIEKFDEVTADATRLLSLTAPLPALKPQPVSAAPQPGFSVEFDNTAQTIRVAPIMDYGIYQQDISESVFASRRYNSSAVSRRPSFEHPGSHIITVENGIIHSAKVAEKQEIEFYQETAKQALALGFTKTLKCQKNNTAQLTEYLRNSWPKLVAHAKQQGYKIIFTKDKLALEQETFRADFTADINAERDWLYFDLACYCGDERVTLEKLFNFINSTQPFWRKDDGTLVEIANRPELERLVRLLKSFHAKENDGFEGSLHRAPELEYVMTSSPHYNSIRAKNFQQFMEQVQTGQPVKRVRLPNRLGKILRPYQKHGIEWLYFLRSFHFAGILADDMGTGKTLQTLCVLAMEKIASHPSLVVCPKTLLYNWQAETKKFFPTLKVLIYDGTLPERLALRPKIIRSDLVIVSFGTLKHDEEFFCRPEMRFNYAVLDEAQFIKNQTTKNAQAVKKLTCDYRLALTGTPLENSVSELWSIYDFLMPGFLGSHEHFTKHFHKPIMDHGDRPTLEHLRHKVAGFMLRRTKAEVLPDLPPKIEQSSQCHLSEEQSILYQQILTQVRGEIFSTVEKKGFNGAQIHILAGLTKLRQACNHPALLIKDGDFRKYESAKLTMCLDLVNTVREGGRKVLIFSQFTKMLDIVSAALQDQNIKHLYLSGQTKDRQTLIEKFNSDAAITVFLISLKAGGTGLNLTAADTVIIFDPWWNPGVENQAIDRAHRIGQTKAVNIYRLLTVGTIEEKIQALKQKKQHLFDALINESKDRFKKLTWDDVRELFA